MGLLLFIIWAIICGYAIFSNRDIFSPVKLYLLTIFVYFSNLFTNEYSIEIYLTYFLYLLIGAVLAIFENQYSKKNCLIVCSKISPHKILRITVVIWVLTLIPIAAQFYLVSYMGGIEHYLARIGFRVSEWQGLGHIITAIRFINVITLFYFGIGLVAYLKRPHLWWSLFFVHFFIFLVIGLLSGSRGFLEIIISMLILYNYLKQRLTVKFVISIAVVLFMSASAIGIARNGFKIEDRNITTGFSDPSRIKLLQGDYGLKPLELVFSQELKELQFGKTFLTCITNFVPRAWWPEKPDPGGVVLTKQYTGNAWDGASNLSTGMIAESILNFGYIGGITFGSLLLFGSLVFIVRMYCNLISARSYNDGITTALHTILYIFCVKTVVALVMMEFTNAIIPLFINLTYLLFIYFIIKYRITIVHNRKVSSTFQLS